MPGDYSIFSFDPFEDYLGVLLQQGRVVLDADFNELVEIVERRVRAGTLDTLGRCVVPKETPDGFRIQLSGTTVTIGRGRIYVHGLLAENHGKPPLAYDARLGEQHGTLPIAYDEQPYLIDAPSVAPMPSSGGPHLLYIDVWQREVTHLEDPDLVEKALAVDTATRLQTAWQVRALADVGPITCATPDDQIPGWPGIIAPSAGRLTTAAVGVPASTDPCIVNPVGGYRGTENRLYRVEIHDRGATGTPPSWKWSRDNNSIGAVVLAVNAGLDQITVARARRDVVRAFQPGDWVEVTDDRRELAFVPGIMRKVLQVDDVTGVITLAAPLPAGEFDVANPSSRHTRVRRWDQKGLVLDPTNTVVADVDASGGVIPLVVGQTYILEDGVQVTFTLEPAGGAFRVGDYWAFAARTVDASVEVLTAAPPRGIKHHYCRLAVVTFPGTVLDCRTLWPPDVGDHGCDCSACVTAESHNGGTLTIQMAIAQVQSTGGKVCLGPGVYQLGTSPVVVANAQSIRLHGHGLRTVLVYSGRGAAIQITGSSDIGVDTLSVVAFSLEVPNVAITVANSLLVRIERSTLLQFGRGRAQAGGAVGFSGFVADVAFRDNLIFGFLGIQGFNAGAGVESVQARYTATFGLYIENNFVVGLQRGVDLGAQTLHAGDTRLAGNAVYGCRESAIVTSGLVLGPLVGSSRVDILHNEILSLGHGIVVSTDDTRIADNDIGTLRTRGADSFGGAGDAIRLQPRGDADGVERCLVTRNRIGARRGNGISLTGFLRSALIKQNTIQGVLGGGIVMDDRGSAEDLVIENNQVLDAAPPEGRELLAAIRVMRAIRVGILANTVTRFALTDVKSPVRAGILVQASDAIRIAGNEISDIGAPHDFVGLGGGILVLGLFNDLDIVDNGVRRSGRGGDAAPTAGPWFGILVAAPSFGLTPEAGGMFKRGELTLVPFMAAKGVAGFIYLLNDRVVILRAGADRASVRGNRVDVDGDAPAVHVQIGRGGVCIMSDNHCVQRRAETTPPAVRLAAGAIVCSSNHLRAARDQLALELSVGAQNFTLLGNVRTGSIFLNGSPLPANSVWTPLNVLLP